MKTILVPLDGSVRAEQILPYVRRLAPLLDARLRMLQVVPDTVQDELFAETVAEAYRRGPGPTAVQRGRDWSSWETRLRHAEGYLEAQASVVRSAGIAVDFDAHLGDPAESIVEAAEQHHAALIALATHGYSGIKRWALGSVTDKVVHATQAPLFVVRAAQPMPAPDWSLRRIMVPLDGSDLARQALPFATELAARAGAELILVQAISPAIQAFPGLSLTGQPLAQFGEVLEALHNQATKEMEALAADLRRQGLIVSTIVANGYPAEVIVDEAAWRHVDLLIMATHGYSGIKRWALGSVADKVLHATTTPLVLVHASAA